MKLNMGAWKILNHPTFIKAEKRKKKKIYSTKRSKKPKENKRLGAMSHDN